MGGMARLGEKIAERLRGFASPWELACFAWVPALMLGYVAWARGVRPGPARTDRGLNALLPSSSLKQESLS